MKSNRGKGIRKKNPVEEFIEGAHAAGCPADQVRNFLEAGYIPLPWILPFHADARRADHPDGPNELGVGGSRGPGKALDINTPIATLQGWTTMGALAPGDFVFAPDGTPTQVLACSPVMPERPCYEVVFSDGARLVADEQHLWVTLTRAERLAQKHRTDEWRAARRERRPLRGTGASPWTVERNKQKPTATKEPPKGEPRTTLDILETLRIGAKGETNHAIRLADPLWLPACTLPLDPYVLGQWLGDGDSARGYFTTADAETVEEIGNAGWPLLPVPGKNTYRWKAHGLTAVLRQVGVLNNKHIPLLYLRASIGQRLALLQGLMDSDGSVDPRDGRCEFTATNYTLASGVLALALTLGIKATLNEGVATLKGREIGPKYRVGFSSSLPCFRLPRKLERQKREGFNGASTLRYIVDVVPVPSVPVRCIEVAHESHCYLAGEQLIVTHNSHGLLAQVLLDDCRRFPGLQVLFLRRQAKDAKESLDKLRRKILANTPHKNNEQTGSIRFPQWGFSSVTVRHFNNDSEAESFLSQEYDVFLLEEATTLSLYAYREVRKSTRSSTSWRARSYNSTNPGGRGHRWYKERFVDPHRDGTEHLTARRFYPATVDDNPYIGQDYKDILEEDTGWQLRAYRYGDWDIAAGQFFETWREAYHVIPPLDSIPESWSVWGAMDYGFQHPTVFLLMAEDGDGNYYAVHEHGQSKWLPRQHAESIGNLLERYSLGRWDEETQRVIHRLPRIVAGHDVFQARGTVTISQDYAKFGLPLARANINRVQGAAELMRRMGDPENGRPATLFVTRNCPGVIRQIPEMQHDPNRPEDILKNNMTEDGEGGDDYVEALRMAVLTPGSTKVPKEQRLREAAHAPKNLPDLPPELRPDWL